MAEILGTVSTLVMELGKYIGPPIKRQFNYLCCFQSNIQNLEQKAEKMKDARDGLQMRVDRAKDNTEEIFPQVETWLKDVNEILENQTGIENGIRTIKNGCLGIKSRFALSRKAVKTAERMEELWGARNFEVISQQAPPASSAPILSESTRELESRMHIEENIMRTLRENEVIMVGICGMGGVGKTTMAERVVKRVMEEKLCDETVKVVVSQQVDKLRIQKEMAESLGLKLEEESLSSRAHKLHNRLVGGKRVLIVIDDVWEYLKLGELGIPCDSGSVGCKVLLTSRNQEILKRMKVQQVYPLNVLEETEAWDLFKSNVGSCIDDQNVLCVAKIVVKECNGLPIALVTLALALKDESNVDIWKAMLQQLKDSNPKHMPEVLEGVYQPLRLSYELLKDEDAKSLFLLCCLFAEDYHIPISQLTCYAVGLRMFEGIVELEEARNIILLLVGRLKNHFLLLKGQDKYHVRMHDVVRDVAIFITSERSRNNCSDCIWYSSFHKRRIEGSNNPNLRLLMIDNSVDKQLQVTDNFFQGMTELNVLFMKYDSLQSLPQTTQLLKSLRTLILDSCKSLKNIVVVSELANLEILICRNCDSIEELPLEIGNLSRLRLLEISNCLRFKKIAPGVMSSLVELEEERKNAGKCGTTTTITVFPLLESLELSNLLYLEEILCDVDGPIPDEVSESITEISGSEEENENNEINGLESHCGRHVQIIFPKLKWLKLEDLSDLTSFGKGIVSIEFPRLTEMYIYDCPRLKSFVSATTTSIAPGNNSGVINHGHDDDDDSLHLFCKPEKVALGSLKILDIRSCENISSRMLLCPQIPIDFFPGLETLWLLLCKGSQSLFSSSLARNLINLRELGICYCKDMVTVIEDEEEEHDACQSTIRLFPKLQELILYNLPKLEIFCKWRCALELPSLKEVTIDSCLEMERFSLGDNLTTPNLETIKWEWQDFSRNIIKSKDLNGTLQRRTKEEKEQEKKRAEEIEAEAAEY